MAKLNKTVIAALSLIVSTGRATKEVGEPLIKMGLIEVNTNDIDENGAAAARLTQKGIESMPVNKNESAALL
jgi:catalase (peroxidase I)